MRGDTRHSGLRWGSLGGLPRGLLWGLLGAMALIGCETDDGGGGGVVVLPDQGPADMAPPDPNASPYADYCQRRAEAVCGWGFECLGSSGTLSVFDLSGPEEADCVAAQAEGCVAELDAWDARGTLNFDEAGGNSCVDALGRAPCLAEPPGTWVAMWQGYVQMWCGTVARGLAATGDACTLQSDCGVLSDSCVDGVCAPLPGEVMVQPCDPGRDPGEGVPDPSCRTGTCFNTSTGGICSAACVGGRTCGPAGVCLQLQTLGGAVREYCARLCAAEDDPACDTLACELITEDGDDRICQPAP